MPIDDEADRRIVRECTRTPDNQEVWQTFFEHFGLRMRIWIRAALPADPQQDRDDVYQNLMFKLFTGGVLEKIDPSVGNPHAYLRRVTFNYCMDAHRQDSTKPSSMDREGSIADAASLLADGFPPKSEDELLSALTQHVADARLDPLTTDIYNALLDEIPVAQVAERFGLSLSTTYRHRADLLGRVRTVLGIPATEKKSSRE